MDSPFDFADYRAARKKAVADIPDEWFRVPFRSKAEGLTAAFGSGWDTTYVPVHVVGFTLHGFLLTHTVREACILAIFQDNPDDWYPVNPPPPALRVFARVRERRATLQRVLVHARTAHHLSTLVGSYASIAAAGVNPQAFAYAPALFDAWLSEQGFTPEQADTERLMAGLSNYASAIDLMRAHESTRTFAE
jgi:hypothetical protein